MEQHEIQKGTEFYLLVRNKYMAVGKYRVTGVSRSEHLITCKLLTKTGQIRKRAAKRYLWKTSLFADDIFVYGG